MLVILITRKVEISLICAIKNRVTHRQRRTAKYRKVVFSQIRKGKFKMLITKLKFTEFHRKHIPLRAITCGMPFRSLPSCSKAHIRENLTLSPAIPREPLKPTSP